MGNNVSANTLFHFTRSLENLESILRYEFHPRYCLEDHRMFSPGFWLDSYLERAIPMVCFCDIPLSHITKHADVYGGYAIGLSKEWGEEKNISPMMYASATSSSTAAIKESFRHVLKNLQGEPSGPAESYKKIGFLLDSFLTYTKPYKGEDSRTRTEKVFYDEREWRFVPDPEQRTALGLPLGLYKNEFFDDTTREQANAKVAEHFKLSFQPKDIKYIIVNKEEEILPMFGKIEAIKGVNPNYDWDDVRLLATRIISLDQILSDF
ncbi:abortive infection system antitoxin AbiGi family protein [Geomonas edaphica]|uniref:abortive infection system antitoxin AbiGi family protein n=1 Tax=Geomonas edaphica TaxID=2570226 RepID=UPI0013A5CEA3|nr:abortive infection system antitoxin AbiGi family protein [Geomonas edaphica]